MEFNDEYYSQRSGTMMGTPFAVEFSCLFMSFQEKLISEQYTDQKPTLYVRYIDDIFGISDMHPEKLKKYLCFVENFHSNLQYTKEIAQSVNMLDTTLTVTDVTVSSSLYTKPTDTHAYVRFDSSHPESCVQSIPYSQFLRVRRICSKDDEYRKLSFKLAAHFIGRGYPRNIVLESRLKVQQRNRDDLLFGINEKQPKKERITFPITFHQKNNEVVKIIKRNFSVLENNPETQSIFKDKFPMIAFKKDKILKDILVRSSLNKSVNAGTIKCSRPRCVTCKHICDEKVVVGPTGYFSVHQSFSFMSSGLVYCIRCTKCGELYVGETGRQLSERFREHRRDVIINDQTKEVASHFNRSDHRGINDIQVVGLKYQNQSQSRKLLEQQKNM